MTHPFWCVFLEKILPGRRYLETKIKLKVVLRVTVKTSGVPVSPGDSDVD